MSPRGVYPPFRRTRRLIGIQFSGQKEIPDSSKYGSSRCFSEMLAIRKDFPFQAIERLNLRILRTHKPVRSKTTHPENLISLDAKGVAEVMIQRIDSLPIYKLAEETRKAKQIREISLEREWLVKERARLKNQPHVLLHRIHNTGYQSKFKDPFSLKALRYWSRSVPKTTDEILNRILNFLGGARNLKNAEEIFVEA